MQPARSDNVHTKLGRETFNLFHRYFYTGDKDLGKLKMVDLEKILWLLFKVKTKCQSWDKNIEILRQCNRTKYDTTYEWWEIFVAALIYVSWMDSGLGHSMNLNTLMKSAGLFLF